MGITDSLVKNIVQTRFESLDQASIQKAKWRIMDGVGCAIAGANAPGCRMMLSMIRKWGGAPESTIFVHGYKVPSHNAAMMNSLMTRSFDFEAIESEGENTSSPSHVSGTTVPTALAMAEQQAASGRDLITALIVGDDLAARLNVATGFDFSLGWDNTGTINRFGAAAVAAKLLKLNEKQVHAALGIALNQVAGTMAAVYDKTMSFKLPIALSSRDAIFSAELAKEGFLGVNDPFIGPRTYFSQFTKVTGEPASLVKDLGKRYYADCIIKPHSACRATHSFIDCALKIVSGRDIKPEEVESIVIHAAAGLLNGFCGQPFELGETPQVNCAFSFRYTVACALLRKAVKPEYYSDAHIRDPRIKMLIDKMQFIPHPPQKGPQGVEIEVTLKNGEKLADKVTAPKGDFRNTALTADEIKAKYRSNVVFSNSLSRENTEKALEMLDNLEEVQDVREIIKFLQ